MHLCSRRVDRCFGTQIRFISQTGIFMSIIIDAQSGTQTRHLRTRTNTRERTQTRTRAEVEHAEDAMQGCMSDTQEQKCRAACQSAYANNHRSDTRACSRGLGRCI